MDMGKNTWAETEDFWSFIIKNQDGFDKNIDPDFLKFKEMVLSDFDDFSETDNINLGNSYNSIFSKLEQRNDFFSEKDLKSFIKKVDKIILKKHFKKIESLNKNTVKLYKSFIKRYRNFIGKNLFDNLFYSGFLYTNYLQMYRQHFVKTHYIVRSAFRYNTIIYLHNLVKSIKKYKYNIKNPDKQIELMKRLTNELEKLSPDYQPLIKADNRQPGPSKPKAEITPDLPSNWRSLVFRNLTPTKHVLYAKIMAISGCTQDDLRDLRVYKFEDVVCLDFFEHRLFFKRKDFQKFLPGILLKSKMKLDENSFSYAVFSPPKKSAFANALVLAGKKAGLNIKPSDFRKSFAEELKRQGFKKNQIAVALNNKSNKSVFEPKHTPVIKGAIGFIKAEKKSGEGFFDV